MAITEKDLHSDLNDFFTTNGKDIWKLESYILGPSCELRNLETEEKQNFGLGGHAARSFHHIEMPKTDE